MKTEEIIKKQFKGEDEVDIDQSINMLMVDALQNIAGAIGKQTELTGKMWEYNKKVIEGEQAISVNNVSPNK